MRRGAAPRVANSTKGRRYNDRVRITKGYQITWGQPFWAARRARPRKLLRRSRQSRLDGRLTAKTGGPAYTKCKVPSGGKRSAKPGWFQGPTLQARLLEQLRS